MRQSTLARYAPLYRHARYFQADSILRRHLGVGDDYIVPLGLSHGVDFGQLFGPMDTHGVEPIYWAYNLRLLESASRIKPAVAIPHPLLLAAAQIHVPEAQGLLVIGPPPGPRHDHDLRELIRARENTTILVKQKQNFSRSAQFWRDEGFAVATIADDGPPSYDSMVRLFSKYERVAGCTFSSALFFAAALGKPVDLIRGHRCRVWEVPEICDLFDFGSPEAVKVGRLFASEDHAAKTELSKQLLGGQLPMEPGLIQAELESAIAGLTEPLHFSQGYPRPLRRLLGEGALRLDKPGIVSRPLADLWRGLAKRDVILQDLDDIALWVEGRTDDNPRLSWHRFRPGETVPGDAVEGYPSDLQMP